MAKAEPKKLKITLVKSGIARPGKHKAVLTGLGLRKLNHSVVRLDTPQIRGMINKISHLIMVEEAE
jgi:large subunit ribosomal protein L30